MPGKLMKFFVLFVPFIPLHLLSDEQGPVPEFKMPERVFTPEAVDMLKNTPMRRPWFKNNPERAAKYLSIPLEQWRSMIEDFAPLTSAGHPRDGKNGICPFCGKAFGGTVMSQEDFIKNPFQAKARCCYAVIYEKTAEMPGDYKAKPNYVEQIPHLDGSLREYCFFVPEKDGKKAPRKDWFCPAGEVWHARLSIIMREVLPDLMANVFYKNDEKAAIALGVILERLADVYPSLPLYAPMQGMGGLAKGNDSKSFLTKEEYISTPSPCLYKVPYWHKGQSCYNTSKLNWGIPGWQDGVLKQMGELAKAFDLIRKRPEIVDYSLKKYGKGEAWEKHVKENLIIESAKLARMLTPTRGNTMSGWIEGAAVLGIMANDPYLYATALGLLETYLVNGWFSDGAAAEAAFNYAGMTTSILGHRWMHRLYSGTDLNKKYPILDVIDKGHYLVVSLLGVESRHADQHAWFFFGYRLQPPPEKDYSRHELSQSYPEYGLTCLRSGAPGSRMETVIDHQNAVIHTHLSRLGIQVFYEGLNILPDIGYASGTVADINGEKWKNIKKLYSFELAEAPKSDPNDPWHCDLSIWPEMHNTALVDGFLHNKGPATLHSYSGGENIESPGYDLQFIDVSAEGIFAGRDPAVDCFRRQISSLTLNNGRSVLLDIFRIRGGKEHELYWHIPGEFDKSSLSMNKLNTKNLKEYFKNYPVFTDRANKGDKALEYMENPQSAPSPKNVWRSSWLIRPEKFSGVTEENRKQYREWINALGNAHLRIWGNSGGSKAEKDEIISAEGPWPSNVTETFSDGKSITTIIAFKNAMKHLVSSRISESPALESTFVNVLEPFSEKQSPTLKNVEIIAEGKLENGGGTIVRLSPDDDKAGGDILVASGLDSATAVSSGNFRMKGRAGFIYEKIPCFTLFDGTELGNGSWGVKLDGPWKMKIVGIIGDLSGNPGESALVVETEKELPADMRMEGHTVTVKHQCNPNYKSSYAISKISRLSSYHWRIDLKNAPPFIMEKMCVVEIDTANPAKMKTDFPFYKGEGSNRYDGRRIRFPTKGLEYAMKSAGSGNAAGNFFELAENPSGNIAAGDSFFTFFMQPGDEAAIASRMACRGSENEKEAILDIISTGTLELQVPFAVKSASVDTGSGKVPLKTLDGNKVYLDGNLFSKGRMKLFLEKK